MTLLPLDDSEQRVVVYLEGRAGDWERSAALQGGEEAGRSRTIARTYHNAARHIREGRHREP